jgi:glycosyltransferase involved in cell wall biosynthesis
MTMLNQCSLVPKVTIGIPVYNGERYLRKVLESVALQSFADFTVIISDNASTDATNSICLEYAERDNRFIYVRQNTNIGMLDNFKYILTKCNTKYFVYLAVDDSWRPDFLKKNIAALENNSNAICSISKVVIEKNGKLLRESNGTYPLEKSSIENLKHYILTLPNDNSRFYGVFRPSVLHEAFLDLRPFHAGDWYMMAVTLMYGTHLEIDEVLMHREAAEPGRYQKNVKIDNKRFLDQIFPILPMTMALIKRVNFMLVMKLFFPLLRLNYLKSKENIKFILSKRKN